MSYIRQYDSIFADLRQRMEDEMKKLVKTHNNEINLPEELRPCVEVTIKYAGPCDFNVNTVRLDNDGHIELDGKCVYETGCGSYYEDAKEIPLNSVCIEHIPFILNSLFMYGN